MAGPKATKLNSVQGDSSRSPARKYRDVVHGDVSLFRVLYAECVTMMFARLPGALGLFLRRCFYRSLFGAAGKGLAIGSGVTLRHPHKIRLGNNVILDDYCMLDAKGGDNAGIVIGDNTYVGRGTNIYCKNGDIVIGNSVSISSNCNMMSANRITIGDNTIIASYAYLLSGGEYDYRRDAPPFAQQSSLPSEGPLEIGANCWIGAHVTVLDAASLGEHCVIGAGAVVTRPMPSHCVAMGVPARFTKAL
jgi:acetyltransferase-like isoleucine patch superfamily enzyme